MFYNQNHLKHSCISKQSLFTLFQHQILFPSFCFCVEAAHQVDPKWIQKKNKALRILNSRRKARDNNDLFEEIQKGDLKRECVEEKCDYEELRETFEDDGKADEWWSRAVRKCTTDPEDQKCDKQHTAKCINQWQKKTCQCKQGWNGDLCKEDVDECSNREVAQTCGEKTCINTEGSFRCGCEAGFTLQSVFSYLIAIETAFLKLLEQLK